MQNGLRIYTATIIIIMATCSLITTIFEESKSKRISSFISLVMYIPMIYYFIRF